MMHRLPWVRTIFLPAWLRRSMQSTAPGYAVFPLCITPHWSVVGEKHTVSYDIHIQTYSKVRVRPQGIVCIIEHMRSDPAREQNGKSKMWACRIIFYRNKADDVNNCNDTREKRVENPYMHMRYYSVVATCMYCANNGR